MSSLLARTAGSCAAGSSACSSCIVSKLIYHVSWCTSPKVQFSWPFKFLMTFAQSKFTTAHLHPTILMRGSQWCIAWSKQPNIDFAALRNDYPSKRPWSWYCWHWNQWSWPFMQKLWHLRLYFKQQHGRTLGNGAVFFFSFFDVLTLYIAITVNIAL